MSDDIAELYKSPSFQFYADDFVADTYDLTAEEVGIYMRLLCRQWKRGSVPTDVDKLARIAGVSPAKMRSAFTRLQPKFNDLGDGLMKQMRLERVRSDQESFSNHKREAGRTGGKRSGEKRRLKAAFQAQTDLREGLAAVKQNEAPLHSACVLLEADPKQNTEANAKQNEALQSPISTRDHLPSVDDLAETIVSAESGDSAAPRKPATTDQPTEPPARPPRLPLIDEQLLAARKILGAIWPRVEPSIGTAMTKTEWGRRNIRTARDLAAVGASVDAVIAAHESASQRLGSPVRRLEIVQDEIARSAGAAVKPGLHVFTPAELDALP